MCYFEAERRPVACFLSHRLFNVPASTRKLFSTKIYEKIITFNEVSSGEIEEDHKLKMLSCF
jgi:hypothetical protein